MSSVGDRLGPYEIIGAITRTEIADVLIARSGEHQVVIKRLRAELADERSVVDTFLSEARLAATLRHEHVARVLEVGDADGVPFLASEYIGGEDLRELLGRVHERGEPVPIAHVLAIGAAVADALHAAHEQRGTDGKPLELVHRGLSPANIAIDAHGCVKVLDFGIARASVRLAATQIQALRAKAPYMSPEQCTGKKLDRRSDVFSLGVVLYELATGRRLFKASTEYLTMSAVVAGAVPSPSAVRADLPPALEAIVMRCLARDPAARYASARDVREALEAAGPRSSPSELAAYARTRSGEPAPVDFDGRGTGLAALPPEALPGKGGPAPFKTKPSPIDLARARSTVPVTPVLIPEGSARKDPTVEPPARPRRTTRAPVPPPRRERPKTIQIPTGAARGDATLVGIGSIRPPAPVGDVTISGTGVASAPPPAAPALDASLSGVGVPVSRTSGFEPGGNTTEIVTALAIETTVDVPAPRAVADADAADAGASRAADAEPTTVAAAPDVAGAAGAVRATDAPAGAAPKSVVDAPSAATPRAGRLSVMAFAARQREVSAVSPVVVPPPTTRLSAPIPIVPAPILDDNNWDSSAFPAPPSATAFVPMGAGDSVRIGAPLGDDAGDSSVLSASFIGAIEIADDAPARNSTEIVVPLPPPRASARAVGWAGGVTEDLDVLPPRRRWWPFAAGGGAVLLVIVIAVAVAGGKRGAQPETAATAARAPGTADTHAASQAEGLATAKAPGTATDPSTGPPPPAAATTAEAADVAARTEPARAAGTSATDTVATAATSDSAVTTAPATPSSATAPATNGGSAKLAPPSSPRTSVPTSKPSETKPATSKGGSAKLATSKPSGSPSPAATKRGSAKLATAKPSGAKPATTKRGSGKLATAKSSGAQPTATAKRGSAKLATAKPSTTTKAPASKAAPAKIAAKPAASKAPAAKSSATKRPAPKAPATKSTKAPAAKR